MSSLGNLLFYDRTLNVSHLKTFFSFHSFGEFKKTFFSVENLKKLEKKKQVFIEGRVGAKVR